MQKPLIEPLSTVALYDPDSGPDKEIFAVLYEWDNEFSIHKIGETSRVDFDHVIRGYIGEPIYFPK